VIDWEERRRGIEEKGKEEENGRNIGNRRRV
jgi:hypothetical protein